MRTPDEGAIRNPRRAVSAHSYSLGKLLGLAGRREDGVPPAACWIEPFCARGEQLDRHMNETLVQKTDHDAGLSGHRSVDRMPRI